MANFCEQGGLWVLSLLLVVLLPPKRYRRHPVMFISGLILLSAGIDVGFAPAVALGRNITPFPKPFEETCSLSTAFFHPGRWTK